MEIDFILQFLDSITLQFDFFSGHKGALGSAYPIVEGIIPTLFAVSGFGIVLNLFNAGIRKKMVDQVKLRRIMKETRAWQKERMAAFRAKDDEKTAKLNQKSSYMNKMQMEMMQMNMRPLMFTFIPLILIFYFVLPELFFFNVAISPVPLNVIPGDFFQLTCTAGDLIATVPVEDGFGNVLKDANGDDIMQDIFCEHDNGIFLWAWYFLSSIAFSGIIMKLTKTSMGLD